MEEIRCPKCGTLNALGNTRLVEIMKGGKRILITGTDAAIMSDCFNHTCQKSISIQLDNGSLKYEHYSPKEENGTPTEDGDTQEDIQSQDGTDTEEGKTAVPEAEDNGDNPGTTGEGTPEAGAETITKEGETDGTNGEEGDGNGTEDGTESGDNGVNGSRSKYIRK